MGLRRIMRFLFLEAGFTGKYIFALLALYYIGKWFTYITNIWLIKYATYLRYFICCCSLHTWYAFKYAIYSVRAHSCFFTE